MTYTQARLSLFYLKVDSDVELMHNLIFNSEMH